MESLRQYNSRLFTDAHRRARMLTERGLGSDYRDRFCAALRYERRVRAHRGDSYTPKAQRPRKPVRLTTFRNEGDRDRFIRRIAEKSKGKFFTVEFTKRTNNERRVMNALFPVPSRFASGRGLRFDPTKKRLLSVFDVGKGAPRFASLERVHRVAAKGYSFEFDGLTCRTYQRS